jgi:RsiW-degrading membrane proteinase PrsW (M82 family)
MSDETTQSGGRKPDCVVCHEQIEGRVYELGGRNYCAEHYAKATMGSRGSWYAAGAMVAGLVVLALLMLAIGSNISDDLSDRTLIVIGLFLAVVPPVLWLGVFYQMDRLEPEPHHYLAGVVVLGALVAGTVIEPIRRGLFDLQDWNPNGTVSSILVHALIPGMLLAGTVYLVVRFSTYLTEEFDERADGVIYGTAAGLGVATLLNFHYVLDHDGVDLDVGTARIIIASLVAAALGGLVGYGLGQIKFERHSPSYVLIFLGSAALLYGIFDWLQSEVTAKDLGYEAWPGVALAAGFAAVVLGIVFYLLRRAVNETLALATAPVVASAVEN